MGGNGARSAFLAKTLDSYSGVLFDEVGNIDGVKVVSVSGQERTAQPMESFSSNMYYVANPKTGEIKHIDFYDKNGNIKHSIDLDLNNDGSYKPYREFIRKGKTRSEGCHFHRNWSLSDNGNKSRKSHDRKNVEPINRYYMRFVNKAIKYNQKIKGNGKK